MMRTYHNKNKNIQSSFYLEARTRKILCFLSLENLYLLPKCLNKIQELFLVFVHISNESTSRSLYHIHICIWIGESMKEATAFHHLSENKRIFDSFDTFVVSLLLYFLLYLNSNGYFIPSKNIRIMLRKCKKKSVFTLYRILLGNGPKNYAIWCEHVLKETLC